MPVKSIVKEFILLMGFTIITSMAINYFSPKGISLLGQWEQSQCVDATQTSQNISPLEFEIDDINRAKEIFDSRQAIFVDARAREFYANGHIRGAISLPLGQFNELIDTFENKYPLNTFIVTYCYGKECDDSHKLAQQLLEKGYIHVSNFTEGFLVWQREGYPIE